MALAKVYTAPGVLERVLRPSGVEGAERAEGLSWGLEALLGPDLAGVGSALAYNW